VPELLTNDHKTKWMGSALKFLTAYAQEGDELLDLFLHLKKNLAGTKFDDENEVQEEVMTWFKEQAADFYDSGLQKPVPRLNPLNAELNPICYLLTLLGAHHILHVSWIRVNKYLNNTGDYVEN